MVLRKGLLLFLLTFFVTAKAYADSEFYGIQMRDERVAKSLVLAEVRLTPEEISQGNLFNKNIYATASLKEDADQKANFSVNIFNNSDKPILADYQYRDFYLVAKDGRKYPLYDPETQFDIDEILPKTNVTFQPSLGNLVISKKNIKMIVCSFDLGRTTLVLFSSSRKATIEGVSVPPMPTEPLLAESKRSGNSLSNLFKGKRAKTVETAPDAKKVEQASGATLLQKDDRTLLNAETQQSFAWPKDNPTAHTQAAVQAAPTDNRLASAIKNFVYVPASGVENAVTGVFHPPAGKVESTVASTGQTFVHSGAPKTDAQVLQYNPAYKFITLNAGTKDGIKKNMLIYILRDGRTVAQARVKQTREAVAAASVIPDSVISEVRAGDKISLA